MEAITVIEPDETAHGLAVEMADADGVMRDILEETVDTVEVGEPLESGRTVCDGIGQIRGALGRFPTSVKLSSCPWGMSGSWHTHTTPEQLRNPTLSLPDMSTVVYGELDVVGVAGTDTAEFLVDADDSDLLVEQFESIIGTRATGSKNVAQLITSGHIDPVDARQQVRSSLPHLFVTVDTGYADLRHRVDEAVDADQLWSEPYEEVEARMMYHTWGDGDRTVDNIRDRVDRCRHQLQLSQQQSSFDFKEMAVGAAVGTTIGNLVERILF